MSDDKYRDHYEFRKEAPAGENDQVRQHILESLNLRKDGRPSGSISNYVTILSDDPGLKDAVAYNELSGCTCIVRPLPWRKEPGPINDTDINYLLLHTETAYGIVSNDKNLLSAVDIVAHGHSFHPIRDRLNSLQWDGKERIRYLMHHFLGAPADDLTEEITKMILFAMIARVFNPGCKFDCMPILIGAQGIGKSTFLRFLALQDEWYSDDIRSLSDDEMYEKLCGHWVIELSEMTALVGAKSIEAVRSFITRTKDTYRVKYSRYVHDFPRQCVFFGTSNSISCLPQDRAGNRRFVPVICNAAEAEIHILADEAASRAYFDQVFAQAMVLYRSGKYSLVLSPGMERQLAIIKDETTPEDSAAGMIQKYLDDLSSDYVCSPMIAEQVYGKPYTDLHAGERREIRDIMDNRIEGWIRSPQHRYEQYGRQKGWMRKEEGTPDPDGFVPVTEQMRLPFTDDKKDEGQILPPSFSR